jgi:hypothetical protein
MVRYDHKIGFIADELGVRAGTVPNHLRPSSRSAACAHRNR